MTKPRLFIHEPVKVYNCFSCPNHIAYANLCVLINKSVKGYGCFNYTTLKQNPDFHPDCPLEEAKND